MQPRKTQPHRQSRTITPLCKIAAQPTPVPRPPAPCQRTGPQRNVINCVRSIAAGLCSFFIINAHTPLGQNEISRRASIIKNRAFRWKHVRKLPEKLQWFVLLCDGKPVKTILEFFMSQSNKNKRFTLREKTVFFVCFFIRKPVNTLLPEKMKTLVLFLKNGLGYFATK